MKAQRWYTIEDDQAFVYDHPHPRHAQSVSIVRVADLAYYRTTFRLTKAWSDQ